MDAAAAPTPTASSGGSRNHPLDGIRGIGTLFVLFGHLGVGIFTGLRGVLAVAMFFTLSGYLIASGLIREMDRNDGRIALGPFYARRARRLLPMATLTVALVAAVWAITDRQLPMRDVVASLTYWQNWNLIESASDYGAIFGRESPFQHYWSLSIEEQFYLALPFTIIGLMWLLRRRRALVGAVLAVVAVGCIALGGVLADGNQSRAYYGTDVRAGEFLAGVALAYLLAAPRVRSFVDRVVQRRVGSLAVTAVFLFQLFIWWHVGFYNDAVFPGWISVNVACTIVLIMASRHETPSNRFLSTRPLAHLGRASYSVYLLHWPFYLLLPEGMPIVVEVVAKVGGATLLGLVFFHLVEEPVRIGERWRGRRLTVNLAAVFAVALVAMVPASRGGETELVDIGGIEGSRDDFFDGSDTPDDSVTGPDDDGPTRPPDTIDDVTVPPPPPGVERVMIVGDSNSFTMTLGLDVNRAALPWDWKLWSGTGCGVTAGDTPTRSSSDVAQDGYCADWIENLPDAVATYDPDVVFVTSLGGDLGEQDLGDGVWRQIGDPVYDEWLAERQEDFLDILTSAGAPVGWLSMPPYEVKERSDGSVDMSWPINHPENVTMLNDMVADLDDRRDDMRMIDFAAWADTWPDGPLDTVYRPDGAHVDGNLPDVIQWWLDTVADFRVDG